MTQNVEEEVSPRIKKAEMGCPVSAFYFTKFQVWIRRALPYKTGAPDRLTFSPNPLP